MVDKSGNRIREFVLSNVDRYPRDIVGRVAARFGISRQAAHKHLARLVDEGLVTAEGATRGRTYRKSFVRLSRDYKVTPDLEEHVIWEDFALPHVRTLPQNVLGICSYGFTEMVNNVLDHSESPSLGTALDLTTELLRLTVYDNGVGIFNKIQRGCKLESPREAVFELTKGKLTTDPTRHTGEGIFFTSRMFDAFTIMSGHLHLSHNRAQRDWLLEDKTTNTSGTAVVMEISPTSTHTAEEVFEHYASEKDDYGFSKTTIAVQLVGSESESLVSRSQARRVMSRLERFKEVALDFAKVPSIGPAFADEIFRVFAKRHPGVRLLSINANEGVSRMIARAQALQALEGIDIE